MLILILLSLPVRILGKVFSMFDPKWPRHALMDSKAAEVGGPEENIEQSPIHVVIVTIIGQTSVSIFHHHKPDIFIFSFSE